MVQVSANCMLQAMHYKQEDGQTSIANSKCRFQHEQYEKGFLKVTGSLESEVNLNRKHQQVVYMEVKHELDNWRWFW